jgi:hypothetical protein
MICQPQTAGELNYVITKTILAYIGDNPSYQRINDVIGALEGAKLEFYRRFAAPYEDEKIKQNGDVYK